MDPNRSIESSESDINRLNEAWYPILLYDSEYYYWMDFSGIKLALEIVEQVIKQA